MDAPIVVKEMVGDVTRSEPPVDFVSPALETFWAEGTKSCAVLCGVEDNGLIVGILGLASVFCIASNRWAGGSLPLASSVVSALAERALFAALLPVGTCDDNVGSGINDIGADMLQKGGRESDTRS